METILEIDKDLLIWINSFHTGWLDPVMLMITKTEFWSPLYLFFIYLIFKKLDRDAWFAMAGAGLTILLADQITASFMKPFFQRLRPSQDPAIQNLIHLVVNSKGEIYRGGLYGFASSHAMYSSACPVSTSKRQSMPSAAMGPTLSSSAEACTSQRRETSLPRFRSCTRAR